MNYAEIEKRRQEQLDRGGSISASAVYSVSHSRDEVLDLIALLVSRLERIDVYENKQSTRNRVKRNLEKYPYPASGGLYLIDNLAALGNKVYNKEGEEYVLRGCGRNFSVQDFSGNYHTFPSGSLLLVPNLWLGDAAVYESTTLIHKDWNTLYRIREGVLVGGPGCPTFSLPLNRTLDPVIWRLW